MSITLKEWEDYFGTLSHERRRGLKLALVTLEEDQVFKSQFWWTGLFALRYSLDAVDPVLSQESLRNR